MLNISGSYIHFLYKKELEGKKEDEKKKLLDEE